MNPHYFADLFDYNFWAHRQVWACVAQLTDEQFDQAMDYSIGSIHHQIAHTMGVEFWWFYFLSHRDLQFVTDADCATRESIRAKWDETEHMIRDYVASLTDEELQRRVKPPFWDEGKPEITVADAMTQIAVHSTDHRAQTLSALHRVGGSTAPQDYLFYLFDRVGAAWEND